MPTLSLDLDQIQDPFQLLQPGSWRCQLMEIEMAESKAGNRMMITDWQVKEGPDAGSNLRHFVVLAPKSALGNLKQMLVAFGYAGSVKVDTADLIGKEAVITVANEPYVDDSGTERMSNSVKAVSSLQAAQQRGAEQTQEGAADGADQGELDLMADPADDQIPF